MKGSGRRIRASRMHAAVPADHKIGSQELESGEVGVLMGPYGVHVKLLASEKRSKAQLHVIIWKRLTRRATSRGGPIGKRASAVLIDD